MGWIKFSPRCKIIILSFYRRFKLRANLPSLFKFNMAEKRTTPATTRIYRIYFPMKSRRPHFLSSSIYIIQYSRHNKPFFFLQQHRGKAIFAQHVEQSYFTSTIHRSSQESMIEKYGSHNALGQRRYKENTKIWLVYV